MKTQKEIIQKVIELRKEKLERDEQLMETAEHLTEHIQQALFEQIVSIESAIEILNWVLKEVKDEI